MVVSTLGQIGVVVCLLDSDMTLVKLTLNANT